MIKNFAKKFKSKTFLKTFSLGVLLFFTFLTILSVGFLKNLKTHYSFEQFQPEHHPLLMQDEKIRKLFNVSVAPYAVVIQGNKKGQWLSSDHLETLLEIEDILYEKDSSILKVVSLASVETAVADGDVFSTGALIDLQQYKKDPRWVYKDNLITPHFLSSDSLSTALYVVPDEVSIEKHALLIEEVKHQVKKAFPDYNVHIGGAPVIRTQMTQLLGSEISLFVSLSLLMALIILIAVFKGGAALFMSGTIIVMANLFSLGVMSFMGIPFTVLSTTLPILVTISVVAITTHTYVRLDEELVDKRDFLNRVLVLKSTFKELVKPHLLTAMTTAVGFGSLLFSQVPLIQQYGLTVALGVLLSCFVSVTLLPALLVLFKAPSTRDWFRKPHFFNQWIFIYRKPIVIGFALSVILFSALSSNLSWTAQLFTDLPAHHEARQSTDLSSELFGGAVPFDISIEAKSPNYWNEPKHLIKLDELMSRWRNYNGIGSILSVSTFIKASQPEYIIPEEKKAISEVYLLYGMANENPLRDYMNPRGDHIRVAMRLDDLPADVMVALKSQLLKETKEVFPEAQLATAGMASTVHELGEEVSKNLMLGFYTALFWIFLLLSLSFQSLKWALISIVPNLVPPSLLIAGLVITETPIKPGIALIFAISLGIAFDNTVYILGRLKELLHNSSRGESFQETLNQLIKSESKPCLVSSLSLMAGFSIFLFSYFEVNSLFGAFMILALIAGLLGDLVFLPAVLSYLPKFLIPKLDSEILLKRQSTRGLTGVMMGKMSLLITLLIPFLLFSESLDAKKSKAKDILRMVEERSSPPFEKSQMAMTIVEPDGSKKERSLTLKRMNNKDQKAIVKISSPADLKGVGFLTVQSGEKEDQWLYLPSSKRARRIVGGSGNSRFLDSDLTYEDFRASTYKNFRNKVLKGTGDKNIVVIESKAKSRGASSYGKIQTWVSIKDYRVVKSKYYNKRNKLIKTMSFKNYKKYGKKYWRAHTVEIKDVKNKRKTLLKLKNVKLSRLTDDEFSISELEEQ